MRLLLTVVPRGRPMLDVAAELEPDVPAAMLAAGLADAAGLPADVAATCTRTGASIACDEPVGSLDLLDGDRIELVPALEADTVVRDQTLPNGDGGGAAGALDLLVVGGPLMGTRIGLTEGEHVVGRGPGADVTLADRSLSRRHLRVSVTGDRVSVTDLGSSNGTFVDGVAVERDHRLTHGATVEAGRSMFAFAPSRRPSPRRADGRGGTRFNRPPRVAVPVPSGSRRIDAPPAAGAATPLPLGAALIPLVLAAAMYAVTRSPVVLMIGALSPAMAFWTHLENRRRTRRTHGEERARYERAFASAVEELAAERADEAAALRHRGPDAAELMRRAAELDPALWERRTGDDDFLDVRVGLADRPSGVAAQLAAGPAGEERDAAQQRLDESATLLAVPVVVSAGALAIVGSPPRTASLGRWVVAQAAVHHSPAELSVALALRPEAVAGWDWVKWLPHARGEQVAVGEAAARELLERLAATGGPQQLLVVDGALALDRALVADVYDAGTSVVWLDRAITDVPSGARTIVALEEDVARLTVTDVGSGAQQRDVAADGVSVEWAGELGRALAPVRDAAARDRDAVPSQVSLLELLDLPDPTPSAVERAWAAPSPGLEAPIGMSADGAFTIDPGRGEGLRGLIAGMPGAGKSELLQGIVAGLAARHPPTRIAFLLVDYKGGAAFGECAELPHTAGLVTDLDLAVAERARVSLLAELRRREELLAAAGARSLAELAQRAPDRAPPALLIVVDEFATLVREVPAFVETMVDVAQRGRSLGLHLILATQRPRGAVSDAVRANTNLRIAMRTADASESLDVIEAPDSAAIPASLPGRAIALTGRRPDGSPELLPFQSAFPGGRSASLGGRAVRVVALGVTELGGATARELTMIGAPALSDLQAIVAASRQAAEHQRLARAQAPWLPSLPVTLELRDLPDPEATGAVALGLADLPAERRQPPVVFDPDADGSLLVFGAAGSGKTTLLRSVALAFARRFGPQDLHVYALDFASRGLVALEALPQCGAVITGGEQERTIRLLSGLERLAEERRALLGQHGVASVAELATLGLDAPRVPRVLLLVDGYAAFASAFERVHLGREPATVQRLAAEGRALGIAVVVATDRRSGIPGALAGVISKRLVLRMADDDDYPALGVPRTATAGTELPPGRGFAGDGTLIQLAMLGGDAARERDAIAALAAEAAAGFPDQAAPAVRTLPERVAQSELPAPARPLQAVLGIGSDTLAPVAVDLAEEHLLVAGPLRSGRSTALETLARSLRRGAPGLQLHLLAPRRSRLPEGIDWTTAASGADACRAAAEALLPLLDRPPGAEPVVVVVDDGQELGELAALEPLVKRGRDAGVRIVAAAEAQAVLRAYGGWLRELRSDRRALLLAPDPETGGEVVGVKLPRGAAPPARPGLGYLVEQGTVQLLQLAAG